MNMRTLLMASLVPASVVGMFWGLSKLKHAGNDWMEKKAREDPLFAIFKENKERVDAGLPPLRPEEVPQDIQKIYRNYFDKEFQRYERNKFAQEDEE